MENGINTVAVYGDSILKGAITGTDSGQLFEIIAENSLALAAKKLCFELNNQSVFGSTAFKTQKRLNRDLNKGLCADIAIIESGGNDCDYDWSIVNAAPTAPHEMRTPLQDFMRIMCEMIDTCRANKITPLVMTMPPLAAERWFNHISRNADKENILQFLGGDYSKLYRNHELYNAHLTELCLKKNVQIVDMRLAMLEHSDFLSIMCMDGIHPNRNGYRFMADVWIRELPAVKKEF